MKRVIYILSASVICLVLTIGQASSQEGTNLPSEQTWNDIQSVTTPSSTMDATNPSLRAAPPEGPSIGETPVGDVSLIALALIGLTYFAFKKKRYSSRGGSEL